MSHRVFLPIALLLTACGSDGATPPDATPPRDAAAEATVDVAPDVAPDAPFDAADALYRYLLGSFDSQLQAAMDPAYFAITVRACRVSVPELGERVMYLEQARLRMAPYRQRVYVVQGEEPTTTRGVSRVFEFLDARPYVGLCDDPTRKTITAADLIERTGCAVHLTWMSDRFEGGTEGQGCESTLMGASYATSEVVLRANGFSSWDRGYNAAGMQVWGATGGPYRFARRSPLEP
jgi:hypothetical protein